MIIPQGSLRKVTFTPAEDLSLGSIDCEIEPRDAITFDQLQVEHRKK